MKAAIYCRVDGGGSPEMRRNALEMQKQELERYAVRKRIDSIDCDGIKLHNFKIDFGEIDPNEKVNGLLGVDFLRDAGIILDLVDLVMYTK